MHPALADLCELLIGDLDPGDAARLLAAASSGAVANSVANADVLAAIEDADRAAALQTWNYAWLTLAAQRPDLFARPPTRMSSVGAALSYALRPPAAGLTDLTLTTGESDDLERARAALADWTGLTSLMPCRALLVGDQCTALARYFDLALPGTLALSLGHEPMLRDIVLLAPDAEQRLRSTGEQVSHLVLTLAHEELHVALARAADASATTGWTPLSTAAEEAIVSSLTCGQSTFYSPAERRHAPNCSPALPAAATPPPSPGCSQRSRRRPPAASCRPHSHPPASRSCPRTATMRSSRRSTSSAICARRLTSGPLRCRWADAQVLGRPADYPPASTTDVKEPRCPEWAESRSLAPARVPAPVAARAARRSSHALGGALHARRPAVISIRTSAQAQPAEQVKFRQRRRQRIWR